MANRLTVAPGGSEMRDRPSSWRASGFWKVRWSSVKASGSSIAARAESAARTSPVTSEAVRSSGGAAGAGAFVHACLSSNRNDLG